MKCFKILLFAASMIYLSTSLAKPVEPEKCPSVAAIKHEKFERVLEHNGSFSALQFSNYGTDQAWGFGIANITAKNEKRALRKAMKALKTLSFKSGPVYSKKIQSWACFYNVGLNPDYHAIAITNQSGIMNALLTIE